MLSPALRCTATPPPWIVADSAALLEGRPRRPWTERSIPNLFQDMAILFIGHTGMPKQGTRAPFAHARAGRTPKLAAGRPLATLAAVGWTPGFRLDWALGLAPRAVRTYELADGSEVKLGVATAEIEFMGDFWLARRSSLEPTMQNPSWALPH